MCLVPGMLESGPSSPSAFALRLAASIRATTVVLAVASATQAVCYPGGGPSLSNVLFVMYAYFVLRPFWQFPTPLVFVENLFCFSLLSTISGTVSAVRLTTDLMVSASSLKGNDDNAAIHGLVPLRELPRAQMITCVAASGITVLCYASMAVMATLAAYDMRGSVVDLGGARGFDVGFGRFGGGSDVRETLPFSRVRPGNSLSGDTTNSFGSFSAPPVGSYAQIQPANRQGAQQEQDRFPGRGFKLGNDMA